jgi:lipoprotein-anchoring transpeptidase ErfK/SrfK
MGKPPEQWLLVDTKKMEIHFCEHEFTRRTFPIGIGKEETPTPTGNYYIHSMCKDPQRAYRADDIFPAEIYGTRAMDLSVQTFDYETWCWRAYSIHGTDNESLVPGRCSHGCIRMKNGDIEELYEYCSPGLLVMIV